MILPFTPYLIMKLASDAEVLLVVSSQSLHCSLQRVHSHTGSLSNPQSQDVQAAPTQGSVTDDLYHISPPSPPWVYNINVYRDEETMELRSHGLTYSFVS